MTQVAFNWFAVLMSIILAVTAGDLEQAKGPSTAAIMPEKTFLFAEARPVPSWDTMMAALDEGQADMLRSFRDRAFRQAAQQFGCTPEELEKFIDPLEGISVGTWEFSRYQPLFVAILTFEDAGTARRLCRTIGGRTQKSETGWGMRYSFGDEFHMGLMGRQVAFSPRAADLDQVGRLAAGDGSGSLAESDEFRNARRRVGKIGRIVAYVQAGQLLEQSKNFMSDYERRNLEAVQKVLDLGNIDGTLCSVSRDGDLLEGELVSNMPQNAVYKLVSGPPQPIEMMSFAPANSPLAVVGNMPQVAERWDRVDSYLASLGPEWRQIKGMFQEGLGLNIARDLVPRLRGDAGFFAGLEGSNGEPVLDDDNMALLAGFKTDADADKTFRTVESTALSDYAFQEKQVGHATLRWIDSGPKLAWAVDGGTVLYGPEEAPIEKGLESRWSMDNVVSVGTPAALLNRLPRRAGGLFLMNLGVHGVLGPQRALPDGGPWVAAALLLPEPGPRLRFVGQVPAAFGGSRPASAQSARPVPQRLRATSR